MAIVFWEDRGKKVLKKELFSQTAENSAKLVVDKSSDALNNPTQLRRFFDEIISFEAKYKLAFAKTSSQEDRNLLFKRQLPFLHMIVPKVKYAEARKLVTKDFTQIITEAIAQINEPEDIKVFTSFFEAFMGHYKFHFVEKKDREKQEQNNRNFGGKR
ncbi:MAG: type III-A CRISPR-associated protein Csm2 [Candidatus Riflebacteria bacterium]|nr:type III-A CRISPR-associated protein Csm2 [Candidatus Riflebacteria bacterium]